MTQTIDPPSIVTVPAPTAAPIAPVSSLLVATAFLPRARGWWARLILSGGRVFPSLTLNRLYMIHMAEWSTTHVRRLADEEKEPLLVFVAVHNAGADDYIASFALFVRKRINQAFGTNVDWQDVSTTRLLTDYVVDHEQDLLCVYRAYPEMSVTDIVNAVRARKIWKRAVWKIRWSRSPKNVRERLSKALVEVTKPPERQVSNWARASYAVSTLTHRAKWRSSTFCFEIPPGRVADVREAVAGLDAVRCEVFEKLGGVHYATVNITTSVVKGYPTSEQREVLDLAGPLLILSIQHDGSRRQLVNRLAGNLHPGLASVLERCRPNENTSPRALRPFLRRCRTRRGLTVNAYPDASLREVQEAVTMRSHLLDLASLPLDSNIRTHVEPPARAGCELLGVAGTAPTPDPGAAAGENEPVDPIRYDLQGNLLEPYSPRNLPFGRHLFVEVPEDGQARARTWLRRQRFTSAAPPKPSTRTMNIAFTKCGLERCGAPARDLAPFPKEFADGMMGRATAELGDTGGNDPSFWRPPRGSVHFVVMIRATDEAQSNWDAKAVRNSLASYGLRVVAEQATFLQLDGEFVREPFGFVDGVSQPILALSKSRASGSRPGGRTSPLGEFVLGHDDEDGAPEPWTQTPLARNGTFLVYRKLLQDKEGFDAFVDRCGEDVAAKIIGRKKNGAPLAVDFHGADGQPLPDFSYANDPNGYGCPIGAHIRRANPRDSLDRDKKRAQRHRLMRRGMTFNDEDGLGTVFMAYCAHIQRQFEFVQGQWLQTGRVFGLAAEQDPLIGLEPDPVTGSRPFLLQDERHPQVVNLPTFVRTLWGEYFFQPSLSALAYLSSPIAPDPPKASADLVDPTLDPSGDGVPS